MTRVQVPSMTRRRALQAGGVGLAAAPVATGLGDPASAGATSYLVGRGISDITGAAAESGMMGYSMPQQRTTGLHQRLRARAFIVVDRRSGQRIAWCSTDQGILPIAVARAVLARLRAKYGDLYHERNVSLSATHTHAGPGGCSHDLAYNAATFGFQKQNFDAVVAGTVEAIVAAHRDLAAGEILVGRGHLDNASANRSREAFDRNPAADKAYYPLGIDTRMTVLRFRRRGADIGAISWFPTHPTSMLNSNTLISGDNKGYASYAWEHHARGVRYLEDTAGFVAAFPQTNAGDMSPNLNLTPGSGPTEDMFENTRIIGRRQFAKARQIFDGAATPLTGSVDYRMRYVDLGNTTVAGRYTPDGQTHTTASGVIGLSTFAGSTEDGPGIPGLFEGTPSPLAPIIELLDVPIPGPLAAAQAPKTGVIPTGMLGATPDILPLQLLKIGQLHLVCGPAEYTIVSGLRIRRSVAKALGVPLEDVILQGYTNGYSQYVTTPEEYDAQHYEGASTLNGRYTLPAYQQEFARLASSMRRGTGLSAGPRPAEPPFGTLDLEPAASPDSAGVTHQYGDVLTAPEASYRTGETVTAVFVTGHPKTDLRRNRTYLEVQRRVDGRWQRMLDDGDWATKFHWERTNPLVGESTATITWDIGLATPAGTYRIVHHGAAKELHGEVVRFSGHTAPFTVA